MAAKYGRIVLLALVLLLAFGTVRLVTGGSAGVRGPEGERRALEPRTVARYGTERPGYRAATDREQFEQLWRSLVQPGPVPEIDFRREWVLGAFLGRKPTGGYQVTIDSVHVRGQSIDAVVTERVPEPDDMVTQAISYPGHIVALPRPDRSGRYALVVQDGAGERLAELTVEF